MLRHTCGQGPIDHPAGAPEYTGGVRIEEEARRGIGQGGNRGVFIGDRAGLDVKIPSPTCADFRRFAAVELESMEESAALQIAQKCFIRLNNNDHATDLVR